MKSKKQLRKEIFERVKKIYGLRKEMKFIQNLLKMESNQENIFTH